MFDETCGIVLEERVSVWFLRIEDGESASMLVQQCGCVFCYVRHASTNARPRPGHNLYLKAGGSCQILLYVEKHAEELLMRRLRHATHRLCLSIILAQSIPHFIPMFMPEKYFSSQFVS
jgi:hypothetical protein